MSAKEIRLQFGQAFERFQGANRKMGALAYNLLHDPDRDKKINNAKVALDEMAKLAKDFDKTVKNNEKPVKEK